MDRFQAMQAFTRIVELGAFGKAADSLELPRASVTQAIQQLEAHLGVQLLQRTTRQVSLTLDGQAYYERCVRLLADLEEAESCFPRVLNNPRGRLRVDLPGALGRMRVIPFLPEFCERYPELELQLSSNDRPGRPAARGRGLRAAGSANCTIPAWSAGTWPTCRRSPAPAPPTWSVMAIRGSSPSSAGTSR
ncbi:putative transcriptional regulator [Pseudomonas aeruginosa]|nr:putative transcriptional regulator [Pseudomonas aeruginosa]